MPAISIIVPVYNVQAYIDRCVNSILEQTYSDFEVVFVDDGSTDDSMYFVRQFARNDSRVVIVSLEKNKGLAFARNTGVARARSSYITFVDSDDFISPNLLETMIRATDRGRFDIVETGCEAIDHDENLLWRYEPEAKQVDNLMRNPDSILSIQEWGVTQKLWRTQLFRGSIKFPLGAVWEDISVVPSLVAEARNLMKVPFVGYSYLQRSGSISHSKSVKHVLDMFRAFERYRRHLTDRRLFDVYAPTFSRVVQSGANYQISQLKLGDPDSDDPAMVLVELCEVLLDEYATGKVPMDLLKEVQFETIIRNSRADDAFSPNIRDQFRSQIVACSEMVSGG